MDASTPAAVAAQTVTKPEPEPEPTNSHFTFKDKNTHEDDTDTASQRSISLSSPADSSPRHSITLSDEDSKLSPAAHTDTNTSPDGVSPNIAHEFLSSLKHDSHPYTLDTDFSSEADDSSLYEREENAYDAIDVGSPVTSAAPSEYEEQPGSGKSAKSRHSVTLDSVDSPLKTATVPIPSPLSLNDPEPKTATRSVYSRDASPMTSALPTYPPTPNTGTPIRGDTDSITSFASTSSNSRKTRPESKLMEELSGPLVLGIALIDFNHLQGPRIEFSRGDIFEDDAIATNLPFLALPDGAHLSTEDYSFFHLVPSSPNPSTVFGISCNRQIASSELLVKDADVTRSTVQKAVVVLASKPVFGPIRDKLGVVTRALFMQRDFSETDILVDFSASLEISLRSQLTESGLYMGTSLRELVHTFRQRTLVLLKALILQKKIMFYGHPVERLCTYQYSLISLLPGLLHTLEDCGSPPLASRAPTLSKPNSLKTSDRKSMMAYMGLPLDVFGKDAFFQPYIPLQQMDMLKETKSWLCGSTNSIVTGQKEIDLLVNTETGTIEYRDPKLERSAGLTAADRKWMDEIVRDVNEGWNDDDPTRPLGMQFKGSDDYLRTKFEEYVTAALSAVRYRDFLAKSEGSGVLITGGSASDATSAEDFNPIWMAEFKKTNAYEVWDRTTDTMLFDIVEPRHPCNEKPTVVSDIGLRLQEGVKDLKLDQQLAPTREAITRTITAGSTGFFKAVEGVRGRWQRAPSSTSVNKIEGDSVSSTPVDIGTPADTNADLPASPPLPSKEVPASPPPPPAPEAKPASPPPETPPRLSKQKSSVDLSGTKAAVGAWGAGIGSFLSTRAARFSLPKAGSAKTSPNPTPAGTPEKQSQPLGEASPAASAPTSPITATSSTSAVKAAVAAVEANESEPESQAQSKPHDEVGNIHGGSPVGDIKHDSLPAVTVTEA